jgi:hypothetical protein
VRRALSAALLFSLSGCAALIERHHAPSYYGKIVDSDRDALYLEGSPRPHRVPASEIKDIDHPGNVVAVGGLVSLAIAALAGGISVVTRDDGVGPSVAITYGAMGLFALAGGLVPWMISNGAASRLELGPERVPYLEQPPGGGTKEGSPSLPSDDVESPGVPR